MNEHPDDIDRIFARLERAAVPRDFTRTVLARTTARQRAILAWPWLIAGMASMALLGLAGYFAGATLAASDGLELLLAVLSDLSVVTAAPGDAVAAIGEVVPWGLVAVAGLSAAFLVWVAGRVVSRTPAVT